MEKSSKRRLIKRTSTTTRTVIEETPRKSVPKGSEILSKEVRVETEDKTRVAIARYLWQLKCLNIRYWSERYGVRMPLGTRPFLSDRILKLVVKTASRLVNSLLSLRSQSRTAVTFY